MNEMKFFKPVWSSRKLSKAAARSEKAVINTEMRVTPTFSASGRLQKVEITLTGDLARVPSIKNSRHPRFPGIDPIVRAKLKALDSLYFQEMATQIDRYEDLSFGQRRIFVGVSFAKQNRSFDEDNALTSIKDWLEPRTKLVGGRNKKARGWGIGLVLNDSQIIAVSFKSQDIKQNEEITRIVVMDLDQASGELLNFTNSIFKL